MFTVRTCADTDVCATQTETQSGNLHSWRRRKWNITIKRFAKKAQRALTRLKRHLCRGSHVTCSKNSVCPKQEKVHGDSEENPAVGITPDPEHRCHQGDGQQEELQGQCACVRVCELMCVRECCLQNRRGSFCEVVFFAFAWRHICTPRLCHFLAKSQGNRASNVSTREMFVCLPVVKLDRAISC